MNNFKRLAPAAYLLAVLFLVIPMVDNLMSVVPLHPGSSAWRFGAIGLLSNALLLPALGLLIAFFAAMNLSHTRLLFIMRILTWAVAMLLVVAAIVFLLDALQARGTLNPAFKRSAKLASITATAKLLIGALTFAVIGYAGRPEAPIGQPVKPAQGRR
ncbi:MAG: hypothetical protein V4550_06135 [Gemmatimonadota bacterium]